MSPQSQKFGTARANIGMAVPPPMISFCCFCLDFKLLYFSFYRKARNFLWNILVM